MKRWMHPWAALYALQVAIAMGVFSFLNQSGLWKIAALIPFALFLLPAVALWRARNRFITP